MSVAILLDGFATVRIAVIYLTVVVGGSRRSSVSST
jgi:hypothetical protein